MKIEDQEWEVGKIFLNTTSANLLCTYQHWDSTASQG